MARRERPRPAPGEPDAWTLARELRFPSIESAEPSDVSLEDAVVELAWPGKGLLACRSGDDARLFDADLRDWSEPFTKLGIALKAFEPRVVVLVGHVCVLDERSRPSFDGLRAWVAGERRGTLVFVTSDLLRVGDDDLREATLTVRRARLDALLERAPDCIVASRTIDGVRTIDDVRPRVAELGLPGIWVRARASRHPPEEGEWLAISATAEPIPASRPLSPPARVTNADKVMYPRDRITKADVSAYYADVADVLLDVMRDRPTIGQRWPDGIDDFTWYQHRVPPRAPDYLKPVFIDGDRRIVIRSKDALLWLVNQAALTFHGWTSRVGTLDAPDWAVIDLDPGEKTRWKQVIDVALAVRKVLELLELPSVVKTSGKKGLHVLVPLAPKQSMELAQTFAQKVGALVTRLLPDVVTMEQEIEKRRGRLYFDCQNFKAKSLVLPYSLRDADGAPVSTPLEWSEVDERLDPKAFTLRALRARLDAKGDLFAAALRPSTVELRAVLAKMG